MRSLSRPTSVRIWVLEVLGFKVILVVRERLSDRVQEVSGINKEVLVRIRTMTEVLREGKGGAVAAVMVQILVVMPTWFLLVVVKVV